MPLALMAGEGALPGAILRSLGAAAAGVTICEMAGHPVSPQLLDGRVPLRFRLETLGSFIATLSETGVDRICFAGRISRPAIDPALIDTATRPLVPQLAAALQSGDDGALRQVAGFFEAAGIEVVGAGDLAPDLFAPSGVLTQVQPDTRARADADRAREIIAAMATVDVGQACVVASGQALALEAAPGTDWMLRSLVTSGQAPDWADARIAQARAGFGAEDAARGGVLVKCAKPGQDLRFDLPTVGVETVEAAARAGLAGVVIEAGRVLMLDRDAMVAAAEKAGLFIWARG